MIDALFGSKTRVKLLHLFLSNPEKSFYVREITRLIDEQINSVRRELANMINVGIIVSDSADNKLYYSVNVNYEHYKAFRMIFGDTSTTSESEAVISRPSSWMDSLQAMPGLRVAVIAGSLVRGSASSVDLLIAGGVRDAAVQSLITRAEKEEKKSLNYAVLSYEDFYYRLSIRDRFVMEILSGKHSVVVDSDKVVTQGGSNV